MFEKIQAIIVEELDIDAARVTADAKVIEDLGADSLDVVDVLVAIEDNLGVTIPQDKVENIRTVGELAELAEKIKGETK